MKKISVALGDYPHGRALLSGDAEVTAKLPQDKLDVLFDIEHALAHVPAIIDRALGV